MDKAVIYARKSTEDKNKQILSLQDQLNECQKIVKEQNLFLISPPFVESKTGWKSEVRAEFDKMLDLIKKGKANIIVTWNLDRIGRNGQENGAIRDLVSLGKLKVITPTNVFDKDNVLLSGFENLINEQYSLKLSQVIKRALRGKVERGVYPNQAPLGYINTPKRLKGARIILPDNKRWYLCRKWWELMLTGTSNVEDTLKEINKIGLRGKSGKPVSRSVAFKFFRNVFYTGNFLFDGELFNGTHKPMITMSEFNRVQKMINRNGIRGAYSTGMELPFMGILKCKECGAGITSERHTKTYKNGTSQTFIYYRCSKKLGPCSQGYLNANEIEPQIIKFIQRLELHSGFGEWFKKVLRRRNKQEFDFSRKQKEFFTRRLIEIDTQKENVYGMKIDGLIDENKYQDKKRELLIEEAQLKEQQMASTTSYWEGVIDQAVDFAVNVSKYFSQGDNNTKNFVLKILGSNLLLNNKKIEIEPKNAFVFLKDAQNAVMPNNVWLEPKNVPYLWANEATLENESSAVLGPGFEPR
ncbi:MAG: recombinase family protein [Patescibacteria group bacterium]